eukprot:TRINITY_DN59471_c0_g1_i1.p2 TRINITY_DN59471_c0_g1~~TRINITY_DN59471_c0_g1_i1.p2  ORF type:complete len:221 (-),score=48.60 TRINITY_DN59471_c0_g1_i1:75-716(-)
MVGLAAVSSRCRCAAVLQSGLSIALARRSICRGYSSPSAESVLAELSRTVADKGTGSIFAGLGASFAPPDEAEARRDLLRRLGGEAEKDGSRQPEALREALAALHDKHPLVRLAAVHTAARVAARGDVASWQAVAELADDADELVRVACVRAIGRMADAGDADALDLLQQVQREAKTQSVCLAARDAEARLLGSFGGLPGREQHPLLGSEGRA